MAKFNVVFKPQKCKSCGLCISVCPMHIIGISDTVNLKGYKTAMMLDQEKCVGCTSCALMCPDGAIEIFKEEQ
ncbi:MAG: 4Fe-4S binding protein [Erysipelotrichaceae bacterium]|nr:4Fe-4S binding protein [Erysipelotrichaceae bacterium]